MAWPFGGAWEGRSLQDLKEIQEALYLAIAEREECAITVETEFIYGDGFQSKARPSAADFDGFPIWKKVQVSPPIRPMIDNIETARQAIEDLLDGALSDDGREDGLIFTKWATSDLNRTPLTLSAVLSLGSYGSAWISIDRSTNTAIWLQLQEALDKLLYPIYWFSESERDKGIKGAEGNALPSTPRIEIRWDQAKAAAETSFGEIAGPRWIVQRVDFGGGVHGIAFAINRMITPKYPTAVLKGTLLESVYSVEFRNVAWSLNNDVGTVSSPRIDVVFTDNYLSFTIAAGSTSHVTGGLPADAVQVSLQKQNGEPSGWPSIGTDTLVVGHNISTAEPADSPFTPWTIIGGPNDGNEAIQTQLVFGIIQVHNMLGTGDRVPDDEEDAIRAYTDASAEFADQA